MCSNDLGTVEDRIQDCKYFKTSSKMSEPVVKHDESSCIKKGKANPFRRNPRGQKNDIVQIIQHPNKAYHTKKNGEEAGKKQSFVHHPQQR